MIPDGEGLLLTQMASYLDGTDSMVIYLLFGGILLCFCGLLVCFVRLTWDELLKSPEPPEVVKRQQVPFIQPSESILQEALPAISPKLMSSKHQPLVVPLKPLQESEDWSLKAYSHDQRVAMVAVLKRRGPQRQRSFLELRDEQEALLGSVTSQLELLLPDGRLYGRLVAHKGAHVLQEVNGRDARWSMAEEQGMITVVWLPKRGSGSRMAQDLKDGLHQLGRQPARHSHKGTLVATVARPEGSNGHRLELMSMSGVDDVLVMLCSLALVTFDGLLGLVDSEPFKSERTEAPELEPSPAVASSQSGSKLTNCC